jgi:hypothetical protein
LGQLGPEEQEKGGQKMETEEDEEIKEKVYCI